MLLNAHLLGAQLHLIYMRLIPVLPESLLGTAVLTLTCAVVDHVPALPCRALQAANAAGLRANLSSPAYSFTLLAPSDAAFTAYLARAGGSLVCNMLVLARPQRQSDSPVDRKASGIIHLQSWAGHAKQMQVPCCCIQL